MPNNKLTIGLIVHNEADRLPAWLDHWTQFDHPIIIVDQSSTDGTYDMIPDDIQKIQTPCRGIAELDRNMLEEYVQGWLLCLDVDEYMAPEQVERMLEVAEAHDDIDAWWLRWRNLVDGKDVSRVHKSPQDQPGVVGCDWHIRLSRGPVVLYDGTPHQHPDVRCKWGYMDATEVWVDHRRTWAHLKNRNRRRNDYLTAKQVEMQERYIKSVAELIGEEV